jgi:asparagine synthase (glutamine-hydrolysing)
MCGIYFKISKNPIDKNEALVQLQKLNHRGPDSIKFTLIQNKNNFFFFGCCLLNVVGNFKESIQPINTENYIIICNGTIYNYKELSTISSNKSDSDIKILGEGLFEEGEDFLLKCNGTYAFVFYNKKKNKLIIGRDVYGVKPLYLREEKNSIEVSSEYKSLIKVNDELNYKALTSYFNYRYTVSNYTLIKQIRKIKPSHIISVNFEKNDLKLVDEKYINTKKSSENINLSELINQSILSRTQRNQNISLITSGGVDSSYIAYLLKKSNVPFEAFTINSNLEDLEDAKRFAKYNDHKLSIIEKEIYDFNDLKRITYFLDDPYGDPIIFLLDTLAKNIKKNNYKICLNGEGVDEIFSGYPHHKVWVFYNFIQKYKLNSIFTKITRYLPTKVLNILINYTITMSSTDIEKLLMKFNQLIKTNNLSEFLEIFSKEEILNYQAFNLHGYKNDIRLFDIKEWLPNSQLFKMDKIFMSHSIEPRDPYLSAQLVKRALENNFFNNIDFFQDKKIFRKEIINLGFPLKYMQKKKKSFTNSINQNDLIINQIKEKIYEEKKIINNLFNFKKIESLIKKKEIGLIDSKKLFIIGSFLAWYENNKKHVRI